MNEFEEYCLRFDLRKAKEEIKKLEEDRFYLLKEISRLERSQK